LLAAFFAAVLPTVFISYGIRRGRWEDRNVGARRARLVVLGFITASVATGLILLAVLGVPALLTGYLAFMLASVAVLAAITLVWKISIHCAVAAGSARARERCEEIALNRSAGSPDRLDRARRRNESCAPEARAMTVARSRACALVRLCAGR